MLPYKTLLVGTDFSPLCQVGLDAAQHIATRTRAQRIHLTHVCPSGPSYMPLPVPPLTDARAAEVDMRRRKLADLRFEVPGAEVTREVRSGVVARELTRSAEQISADLLIVGSHRRSMIGRAFLGSVAGQLIRTAHCPVLVASEKHPAKARFARILVGIDLSPASHRVLEHAFALAKAEEASVHVVSAFEPPLVLMESSDALPRYLPPEEIEQFEKEHEQLVRNLVESTAPEGIQVKIDVLRKTPPALVLLDVLDLTAPDLVVVGTSGHNAWHRFLIGSTTSRILGEAAAPVLVVPFDAA